MSARFRFKMSLVFRDRRLTQATLAVRGSPTTNGTMSIRHRTTKYSVLLVKAGAWRPEPIVELERFMTRWALKRKDRLSKVKALHTCAHVSVLTHLRAPERAHTPARTWACSYTCAHVSSTPVMGWNLLENVWKHDAKMGNPSLFMTSPKRK